MLAHSLEPGITTFLLETGIPKVITKLLKDGYVDQKPHKICAHPFVNPTSPCVPSELALRVHLLLRKVISAFVASGFAASTTSISETFIALFDPSPLTCFYSRIQRCNLPQEVILTLEQPAAICPVCFFFVIYPHSLQTRANHHQSLLVITSTTFVVSVAFRLCSITSRMEIALFP